MESRKLFKTIFEEWLTQKKLMVTPSTYAGFVLSAENHILPKFGELVCSSITEMSIQQFITDLVTNGRIDKKGGLSLKTGRDIALVLRLSLDYAYKVGYINKINWDIIEYPKDHSSNMVRSLSKEDELSLIQCIYLDLNSKSFGILLALFTGVRIGELCGLQMKDISLEDMTINVNKTVQRIYDKRKGTSKLHIGAPKTTTSFRVIPVPSMLRNVLKKFYITESPEAYLLTGKKRPTEPRTYRQYFNRFLKRNGLDHLKFHEIRHTFAVRAIEIPEFDIKSLSEILGHKNVSFTLNVYGRANVTQKRKCMNLLNELL